MALILVSNFSAQQMLLPFPSEKTDLFTVCKAVLLDTVHSLSCKITELLIPKAGFCFDLQVKREKRKQSLSVEGLFVEDPWGPTDWLPVLFPVKVVLIL
jgi:hypothetical protein